MAKLDIAVDHGQSPQTAQAHFEHAVAAALDRFSTWIRSTDWSEERESVRVVGPGFDVELTFDDQKVYARGTVPLAFRLMEGPIKLFIARAMAEKH
jgi:hypothetical protein